MSPYYNHKFVDCKACVMGEAFSPLFHAHKLDKSCKDTYMNEEEIVKAKRQIKR